MDKWEKAVEELNTLYERTRGTGMFIVSDKLEEILNQLEIGPGQIIED